MEITYNYDIVFVSLLIIYLTLVTLQITYFVWLQLIIIHAELREKPQRQTTHLTISYYSKIVSSKK